VVSADIAITKRQISTPRPANAGNSLSIAYQQMKDNRTFYKKLINHTLSLEGLLAKERLFKPLPADWHIVMADVKNSTTAVKNGLHHDVNLTATGSVIAVLNILRDIDKQLQVPYFFGGDGATFLVPDFVVPQVLTVLENFRHHVQKNLYLELKVGAIAAGEMYKENRLIKIAKFRATPSLSIPIVLGTGLKTAEKTIKAEFVNTPDKREEDYALNLEGMECRWDEIAPPKAAEKIACLLVDCPVEEKQAEVYHKVISRMNKIFGKHEERQPISRRKLKLDLGLPKIKREMYARLGKFDFFYLISNWFYTLMGSFWFKFSSSGNDYLQEISQLSHTLMVDGTLNCIISGTTNKIDQLIGYLDELETQQEMTYGIHITHASIMSCYVQNRSQEHVHFIDGTEGGFTKAAEMFKAKLIAT